MQGSNSNSTYFWAPEGVEVRYPVFILSYLFGTLGISWEESGYIAIPP